MSNEHLFTDGFFERLTESKSKEAPKHRYFYNITPPGGPWKTWFPDKDIREQWYDLVNTYTNRKLTVPADRLPAISGLAAYFSKALNDEYKAGLWKSKLSFELLWTLAAPEQLEMEPSQYQGPSWSWAAVNQQSIFQQKHFVADDCFEAVDCQTKTQSRGLKAMINNSEFGAVESGSLPLRGRLQMANWKFLRAKTIDGSSRVQYCQYGALYRGRQDGLKVQLKGASMYLYAFFNDLTADKFPISVYLMIIGKTSTTTNEMMAPGPNGKTVGLVLKRESATEYKRLGIFNLKSSRKKELDWLNSFEVQNITIL